MLQGIENYEREKALYDGIVIEYLELEDIVRNQSNSGGPYQSTLHTALPKALAYLEWWWKCALRGPILRCGLTPHRSLDQVHPPSAVVLRQQLRAASRSRGSHYDA